MIARTSRDFVWIMARTPVISDADYDRLVEKVAGWGYDTEKLERVPAALVIRPVEATASTFIFPGGGAGLHAMIPVRMGPRRAPGLRLAADPARRGSLRAFLRRWPEAVVRHPWVVIAFWIVVAVVVIPGAKNIENRLEVAARMPSEQAQAVHDDLQRRFRSPFTDRVLLVVEGVPLPTTPEGREALETIVRDVKKTPGVAGTLSSLDTRDAIFAGKQGGFLVIVGLDAQRTSGRGAAAGAAPDDRGA